MKMLKIIVMAILVLLFLGVGNVYAGETYTCHDGDILDADNICTYLVPPDFPKELIHVFCNTFCTIDGQVLITPLHNYPQIIMGLASASGSPQDDIIFTWFGDTTTGKYIAFVRYENGIHKICWISNTAPAGLKEYIERAIDNIKKQSDTDRF